MSSSYMQLVSEVFSGTFCFNVKNQKLLFYQVLSPRYCISLQFVLELTVYLSYEILYIVIGLLIFPGIIPIDKNSLLNLIYYSLL